MKQLSDKTIFITGAGQGLGRALALACAHEGATVVLHGRRSEKLDLVYDAIMQADGPEPFLMPLDFASAPADAFRKIALAIETECGKLDGLVHCATELGSVAPVALQSLEHLRATWLTNVLAPILLTQSLERMLRAATSPRVLFTTDSHVQTPGPFWGGYGVSKAAIDHFAHTLAQEWTFAQVHAIAPGAMDSPLRNKTHPGEAKTERVAIETVVLNYLHKLI